jgi:mitofusin
MQACCSFVRLDFPLLFRLVGAIDATKSILNDVREFSHHTWPIRYPSAPAAANEDGQAPPSSDCQVLKLDLKLGPGGAEAAATFVSQLGKSAIANLLDERIASSISHVDKLRTRVEDTSSKVLVTGDLNAGKSTFVNALLRREVMPVDQQPCTAMFCEVYDAAENNGTEEVHVIKQGIAYDKNDESTFIRAAIANLGNIVSEAENAQHILKLYVTDARQPTESLLHNGVVNIALIDAPGLNRDSLKTTALFAHQEEIDVVVFVVSAENHFTLSAREFLSTASKEKAYVFIVVNRFDQIKDKARCKRLVLEQIKELSPRTFEDAEELVHFVDSNSAFHSTAVNGSFDKLESDLRSFVLVKRSKSKLAPVTTYLDHLLADISFLSSSNATLAQSERDQARAALETVKPVLEKMKKSRDELEDGLENIEEEGSIRAQTYAREQLTAALDKVGKGEIPDSSVALPEYPGVLGIWEYTRDVKRAMLASLDMSVKLAEDETRTITTASVSKIGEMADTYLPEGVERSRRVFMPQAMFSPRPGKKTNRRSGSFHGTLVAGGTHGLGLGLTQRQNMLDVSFFDIFDAKRCLSVQLHSSEQKSSSSALVTHENALGVASLGLGALTVAGGKAFGARGLVEGVVRISNLMANDNVRKWAAPILGTFTIGLTIYFIIELPSSIPRNVGRRIKASLMTCEEGEEELKFVNVHTARVGREARKVLRLASWDLRERFRGAMEKHGREVERNEEIECEAIKAFNFFEDVVERAGEVQGVIHA